MRCRWVKVQNQLSCASLCSPRGACFPVSNPIVDVPLVLAGKRPSVEEHCLPLHASLPFERAVFLLLASIVPLCGFVSQRQSLCSLSRSVKETLEKTARQFFVVDSRNVSYYGAQVRRLRDSSAIDIIQAYCRRQAPSRGERNVTWHTALYATLH